MYLYQFFLERTEILEKFFCSGFLLTVTYQYTYLLTYQCTYLHFLTYTYLLTLTYLHSLTYILLTYILVLTYILLTSYILLTYSDDDDSTYSRSFLHNLSFNLNQIIFYGLQEALGIESATSLNLIKLPCTAS